MSTKPDIMYSLSDAPVERISGILPTIKRDALSFSFELAGEYLGSLTKPDGQ